MALSDRFRNCGHPQNSPGNLNYCAGKARVRHGYKVRYAEDEHRFPVPLSQDPHVSR